MSLLEIKDAHLKLDNKEILKGILKATHKGIHNEILNEIPKDAFLRTCS